MSAIGEGEFSLLEKMGIGGGIPSEAAAIQPGQIGALGSVTANLGKALREGFHQVVPIVLQVGDDLIQPGLGVAPGRDGRVESRHAESSPDVARKAGVEGFSQFGTSEIGHGTAQPGDVEGLARGRERHGARLDFRREFREGDVLAPVEGEVGMDLVGNHDQVIAECDLRQRLQLGASEYPTRGIVGVAEEQDAGFGIPGCREAVEVDFPAILSRQQGVLDASSSRFLDGR